MNPWRRYGWIGVLVVASLFALLVWWKAQPPPMPSLPPGANARTEDAPDH